MKQEIVANLVVRVLALNAFAGYRRTILVVLAVVGSVVTVLTSADLVSFCADATEAVCVWLNRAQAGLVIAAGWIGTAGELFKNKKLISKS